RRLHDRDTLQVHPCTLASAIHGLGRSRSCNLHTPGRKVLCRIPGGDAFFASSWHGVEACVEGRGGRDRVRQGCRTRAYRDVLAACPVRRAPLRRPAPNLSTAAGQTNSGFETRVTLIRALREFSPPANAPARRLLQNSVA